MRGLVRWLWCFVVVAATASSIGRADSLAFEQLDWFGLSSNTANSSWGRVTIDFTGYNSDQYFSLNVGGTWVIQNMGVGSAYGAGVAQKLMATFDLGVEPGTNVPTLDYAWSMTTEAIELPDPGSLSHADVADKSYQIGGEGGVDLGSPDDPYAGHHGAGNEIVDSAYLPGLDKFVNQPQGPNECAPGAISNSLKYLQARGGLPADMPTSIGDIKPIIDWDATGAPQDWPTLKANGLKDKVVTVILRPDKIDVLIDAIRKGRDVELDLDGHVAVIGGVRKFEDGSVELDIFDDDQKDDKADPIRTVCIEKVGEVYKVDGMGIDGYVVERPVPEPAALGLFGLALMAVRRRRK